MPPPQALKIKQHTTIDLNRNYAENYKYLLQMEQRRLSIFVEENRKIIPAEIENHLTNGREALGGLMTLGGSILSGSPTFIAGGLIYTGGGLDIAANQRAWRNTTIALEQQRDEQVIKRWKEELGVTPKFIEEFNPPIRILFDQHPFTKNMTPPK